jgi:hypothetical protein
VKENERRKLREGERDEVDEIKKALKRTRNNSKTRNGGRKSKQEKGHERQESMSL